MFNQDIRQEIKDAGLFYYQIAEQLGINDGNFSRLLRHELPQEKKEQIRGIIQQLAKKDGVKNAS